MRKTGLYICLLLFIVGCGVDSGAGDKSYKAVVNGELNYDYGKPVFKEIVELTSHTDNCSTEGVSHGTISPSVLGQFRVDIVRTTQDPVQCLKLHRSDMVVELPTRLNLKSDEPFDTVSVTAIFPNNEEPVKIVNEADHLIIVDLFWAEETNTSDPPDLPSDKSLDDISLPELQSDNSFSMPLIQIKGTYEDDMLEFMI